MIDSNKILYPINPSKPYISSWSYYKNPLEPTAHYSDIKYAKPIKNMWHLKRISSSGPEFKIYFSISRDFIAIAFYFGIYTLLLNVSVE